MILVTGGAGFVGHHFVDHLLKHGHEVVVWDKLTYASTLERLRHSGSLAKIKTLAVDFSQPIPDGVIRETGMPDAIIHLGAESHVDRSILDPLPFVMSNVVGTHHMLEYARKVGAAFFYFSTDEVFGPAPAGVNYAEHDRHNPTNPYSATKAGGEMLVMAYANTFGLKTYITRCMNIFGERQHAEKFIPLVIRKVMNSELVTIHASADKTKAGSRFYIHARNVADAYLHLMKQEPGAWNIVGEQEVDNLTLAQMIAEIVGKPLRYEMVDFHSSRPGHDLRYALDGGKLARAGWVPPKSFVESLDKTVRWFMSHPQWLLQ